MPDTALVVATMTLARDPPEEVLIARAFRVLAAPGRRIVATDGGSREAFLREIGGMPGVTVVKPGYGRGLLAQVQTSLALVQALGAPAVLYTEPDKLDFFDGAVDGFLDTALPQLEQAGVVLAGRDGPSLATYPAVQQAVERDVNDACARITGMVADYCYGPFLLRRELLPYVLALSEDVGWGWRPYVFAVAHALGLGIRVIHGDRPCPEGQRIDADPERRHRLHQREQNLHGLRLATSRPPLPLPAET